MLKLRTAFLFFILSVFILISAFMGRKEDEYSVDQLRALYSSGSTQLWPKPNLDTVPAHHFTEIGALGPVQFPTDNPSSKEKILLGKMLFFESRLSLSKQIACASCHDPELVWGDGRHLAFEHNRQNGKRNSMTIINSSYHDHLFWDGRAKSLGDQVQFPVQDKAEMAQSLKAMVKNVGKVKGYKKYFADCKR